MEAICQVVNSTGDPVEGVSVSFYLGYDDLSTKVVHHTNDSTGCTGFAVESVSIKKEGFAFCSVYLTDDDSVHENHYAEYSEVESKTVDNTYYWSISDILVKL